MAENSGISWTHNTWNPWVGCDKVAPECAHCYIGRILPKQRREAWGTVYRTDTWESPWWWEQDCIRTGTAKRVFTCSLSDFFHAKADPWRREAWTIIKGTPHLAWLILTKRPELIEARLPHDWGNGYPNVWLGVSTGCRRTLNKMDTLRRIPATVRWISAEPLIEDISADINLDGFHWVVAGGESGAGNEYLWNPDADWKSELKDVNGRRTMRPEWAVNLRNKVKAAGLPFMFKQVTNPISGYGYNALDGKDWHEFPHPPTGLKWAPRQPIPDKYVMTPSEWRDFMRPPREMSVTEQATGRNLLKSQNQKPARRG
jgi:protein gp37